MSINDRDAQIDRVVNLLLRVSQDHIEAQEESRRLRETVTDAVQLQRLGNARGERLEKQLVTTSQNINKRLDDIEGHLASFLPQIHVETHAAAQQAGKAAQSAASAATDAKSAASDVKDVKDKTDKFPLITEGEIAKAKGPWTHFLERLDKVSTRTWLFAILALILGIAAREIMHTRELDLKQKLEAPHALDVTAPSSTVPDRNTK